jgi:hypothetical protein
MNPSTRSKPLANRQKRGFKSTSHKLGHFDERACQLADIVASSDEDNAECAAADLFREFPPAP